MTALYLVLDLLEGHVEVLTEVHSLSALAIIRHRSDSGGNRFDILLRLSMACQLRLLPLRLLLTSIGPDLRIRALHQMLLLHFLTGLIILGLHLKLGLGSSCSSPELWEVLTLASGASLVDAVHSGSVLGYGFELTIVRIGHHLVLRVR